MVLIVKDFDRYKIKYASIEISGVTKANAAITCYNGVNLDDVGTIWFFEYYPIPKNSYVNNKIKMHYHISRFNDIIGILRHEKWLRLHFDDAKLEGSIQTLDPVMTGVL